MAEAELLDYHSGWHWDHYQEAKAARAAWMTKWQKTNSGDPMVEYDYVRLRLTEEVALMSFARYRHQEIAKAYVREAERNRQNVGKAYGRASRTIRDLRDRLQNRAQFQREAIRNCTCGAWRRTHHELFELTEGTGS